jgi:hypothetical protein
MRKAYLFPFGASPVGSISMADLGSWGFDGVVVVSWPRQAPDYTAFRAHAAEAKAAGLLVTAAWWPYGNDSWLKCWPDDWLQEVPHIIHGGQFVPMLWEQPEVILSAMNEWALTCQQLGVAAIRIPIAQWGEPCLGSGKLPDPENIGYTSRGMLDYIDRACAMCSGRAGALHYTIGGTDWESGYDTRLWSHGMLQAAERKCVIGWFGMTPNPDAGLWEGQGRAYTQSLQFGLDLAAKMTLGIHFEEQCPPPQEGGPDTFAEFQGCLGHAKVLAAGGDCYYVHRRDCMDKIKAGLGTTAKMRYKQALDTWRAG